MAKNPWSSEPHQVVTEDQAPLPPELDMVLDQTEVVQANIGHVADIVQAVSCPYCTAGATFPCIGIKPGYVHLQRLELYEQKQKEAKQALPESGTGHPVYSVACPVCLRGVHKKCRTTGGVICKPHKKRFIAAGLEAVTPLEQPACPACGVKGTLVLKMVRNSMRPLVGHVVGQPALLVYGPLAYIGNQDDQTLVQCSNCGALLASTVGGVLQQGGWSKAMLELPVVSKAVFIENDAEMDCYEVVQTVSVDDL